MERATVIGAFLIVTISTAIALRVGVAKVDGMFPTCGADIEQIVIVKCNSAYRTCFKQSKCIALVKFYKCTGLVRARDTNLYVVP